jgi:spermidine/putrescine transport system substrate-binding protein
MDPKWVDVYWDAGRNYSVPWQWGTTAFTVDTEVYGGDIDTLALLFDTPDELKGRINMLSDMGEVINAALRYKGYDRCNSHNEELRDITEMLIEAKEDWRTMDYATIEKLTSGDVDLSQTWNGAAMRAREQRPSLVYAYPVEGFTGWMDNAAVLAEAPNMENAKLFLNFIMIPENAALISDFAKYANGITGSEEFMSEDLKTAPEIVMPASAPAPDFVKPCPQEVTDMYNRIWTKLKQ